MGEHSVDDFVVDNRVKELFTPESEVLWHTNYNPAGLIAHVRSSYEGRDIVFKHLCGASGSSAIGWIPFEKYDSKTFYKMKTLGS